MKQTRLSWKDWWLSLYRLRRHQALRYKTEHLQSKGNPPCSSQFQSESPALDKFVSHIGGGTALDHMRFKRKGEIKNVEGSVEYVTVRDRDGNVEPAPCNETM